jgi:predicted ATP-grasp superfamily ATP-dependent carboligase
MILLALRLRGQGTGVQPAGSQGYCPKAAVVLCLRGDDPFLEACLEGLLHQDYPDYDVKIVVDQPTDPAWHKSHEVVARAAARNVQIEPLSERLETCSLKGSSLAQAVSRLDDSYRVVAFLDGDTIPHRTWLRELVAPLEDAGVGVASGNRWYVLGGPHWGTLVRYVWNCAAVVQMYWNRFTWGGSLALRAEIARHPDLIARWRSAVSTDTVILRVVRAEGFRTAFVPSLIMTNREGCRLRDFFVWVQRQLAVGRLYHSGWPAVLGHGFIATAVPVAAVGTVAWKLAQRQWGQGLAIAGASLAYWALMAAVVLLLEGAVRAVVRRRGEEIVWPDRWTVGRLLLALPLTQAAHAAALWKAAFLRTFQWRGVVYQVDGPWQVRLVEYHPYQPATAPVAGDTSPAVESVSDLHRSAAHRSAANGRPERLRVLLTDGSSVASRIALYLLGSRYTIDVLDPRPLCQSRFSRYVRRCLRCPPLSRDPQGYWEFLREQVCTGRYDVLLPTHEQVYVVSRFQELLRPHVAFAVPEFSALQRLQGKADFVRLLDELQLPYPPTQIVRTRRELDATTDFPCFVKLAFSTAGQGVQRVADREQLRELADRWERAGLLDGETELLVQQPAVGVQSAITTVFQHGRLVAAHCAQARALGVGGSAMMQESAWHPVAVEHVRQLGQHLNWHGGLFLDYYYDAARELPQYIEANPRVGPSVNGWLSGVNVMECLLRVSLDEPVAWTQTQNLGLRTHQGFLILLAKALEGAGRGRLLGEMWRHWTGRDGYRDSADEVTRLADDWWSLFPYLGVSALLLLRPRAAEAVVRHTVENYSLPETAARQVRELDDRV